MIARPCSPPLARAAQVVTRVDFAPVGVGFVVGVVVGMTSTGGGALLTPSLVLILRVPPALAIGSDVFIASMMKLVGGGLYALRGAVHWPTVLRLALGSLPGAALGVTLLNRVPVASIDGLLKGALGVVLVFAGAAMVLRLLQPAPSQERPAPPAAATVAFGFVTGLLVSTTSVGSGTIVLCVLGLFYPLTARTMIGTDLVHALLLTSVASVGHFFSGRVDLRLALAVAAGAMPGVALGVRATSFVPERVLRGLLATLLVGVGVYLISTRF